MPKVVRANAPMVRMFFFIVALVVLLVRWAKGWKRLKVGCFFHKYYVTLQDETKALSRQAAPLNSKGNGLSGYDIG